MLHLKEYLFFLLKKANASLLIPKLLNLLIRAIKTVDSTVIGVEIHKYQQHLKEYKISFERYFEQGKIELLN